MSARWAQISMGCLCAPWLASCLAAPPLPCGEADEQLGVSVAASSDGFELCASCEPRCFRAVDTIRSADVAARGGGGLTFVPELNGATCELRRLPCARPPCPLEWQYLDGASYERAYAAYDAGFCDPTIETPIWADLEWAATIPEGTSITLEIRMSNSTFGWSELPVRSIELTGASAPPLYLSRVLQDMGLGGNEVNSAYAIVRVVLHPSGDRLRAPALRGLSLELQCLTPD